MRGSTASEDEMCIRDRFYFVLNAANHQVIGTSQMYAEQRSRDGGIASVKQNGSSTEIKDLTA